jgi:midasin (ATPase involved in ribosome maturation)
LFKRDVDEFEIQHIQANGKFAFGFVDGPLTKALRSGDWCVYIGFVNYWRLIADFFQGAS